MKLFWIAISAVLSAPIPSLATDLVQAITAFQTSSGISYELIRNALLDPKNQLNVTIDQKVSVFLPSDSGLTKLPFTLLTDTKAMMDMVSYHVLLNSTISPVMNQSIPYTTLLNDDIKVNGTSQGTFVVSGLESASKVLGNTTIGNMTLYFVDEAFQPPLSFQDTLDAYRIEALYALWDKFVKKNNILSNETSHTYLVPTDQSLKNLIKTSCKGFGQIQSEAALTVIKQHMVIGKVYSGDIDSLIAKNMTLNTANNVTVSVFKTNNTVTLSTPTTNVTVLGWDTLVKGGVAHLISSPILPANFTLCDPSKPNRKGKEEEEEED